MAKAKHAVPEGHHTVTPQLTLDNAAQAIDWYKKALGAEEVSRAVGPDGKVMHAEIRVGDSPDHSINTAAPHAATSGKLDVATKPMSTAPNTSSDFTSSGRLRDGGNSAAAVSIERRPAARICGP